MPYAAAQLGQQLGRPPSIGNMPVAPRPQNIPQGLSTTQSLPPNLSAPQLPPPQQQNLLGAPPTGLIGSEQALQGGLAGSARALGQGFGAAQGEIDLALAQGRQDITGGQSQALASINQATGQAINPLQGFTQQGQQASQLQAAQSGALGPEAQAQAFQNFQSSPGQQFALEQAELASRRNASASGGLGGGNFQAELQRQAIGYAQQDFGNQFNRLGEVSNRGFQGAQLQSGIQERLGQNQANIQTQGGQNLANLSAGAGQSLAGLSAQQGLSGAQLIGGVAQDVAQQRYGTGQQIAQAASGTTASLANLQNQLGSQFANIAGQGTTNMANLASGTGQAQSQLTQQLSTLLANVGTGSATSAAQSTQLAGQFDAAGILGQNTAVQNALSQLIQLIPSRGTLDADIGRMQNDPDIF